MEGKTRETAAAMSGMSVRSARKWQSGPLPSETKPEHWWRTRPDPFDGVWEEEIEPLLRDEPKGKLKATAIIEWLEEQHSGRFSASQLRTLPVASFRNVTETLAPGEQCLSGKTHRRIAAIRSASRRRLRHRTPADPQPARIALLHTRPGQWPGKCGQWRRGGIRQHGPLPSRMLTVA